MQSKYCISASGYFVIILVPGPALEEMHDKLCIPASGNTKRTVHIADMQADVCSTASGTARNSVIFNACIFSLPVTRHTIQTPGSVTISKVDCAAELQSFTNKTVKLNKFFYEICEAYRPAQNVHDLLCYLKSNTFLIITRHPQHILSLDFGKISWHKWLQNSHLNAAHFGSLIYWIKPPVQLKKQNHYTVR